MGCLSSRDVIKQMCELLWERFTSQTDYLQTTICMVVCKCVGTNECVEREAECFEH